MTDFSAAIDKRVATWLELRKKIQRKEVKDNRLRKTITISREFGCEGYPLAKILKSKLDRSTGHPWIIFDEDAIETVSSEKVLSAKLPVDLGDQGKYLDAILETPHPAWKTEEAHYVSIAKTIFTIAQDGHAILLGRGAFAITKNLPNSFHFRLIASEDFRARCYADRNEVSISEAIQSVREREEARAEFLRRFLETEFSLYNFHLIFNDDKISTDQIADTIGHFIDRSD